MPGAPIINNPNIANVEVQQTPVTIGGEVVYLPVVKINEKVHVAWNGTGENNTFFAAPSDYSSQRMRAIAENNVIGKKYGDTDLEDDAFNVHIYNRTLEIIHPKGIKVNDTTRMTGHVMQTAFFEKNAQLKEIKRITIKLRRKVFRLNTIPELGNYGQLYYGVWLETASASTTGWHRGVDVGSGIPMVDGIGVPVYNIREGIVVGKDDHTMLDIYIPKDHVTITYMHHRYDTSGDTDSNKNILSLGMVLQTGDRIGTENYKGLDSESDKHAHVEINQGCCHSSAAITSFISNDDFQVALNGYYDDKISIINEQINSLSRIDASFILDEIKSLNEQIVVLTTEKEIRNGSRMQQLINGLANESTGNNSSTRTMQIEKQIMQADQNVAKINSERVNVSYSKKLTGLTSLYPYDYFDKWC